MTEKSIIPSPASLMLRGMVPTPHAEVLTSDQRKAIDLIEQIAGNAAHDLEMKRIAKKKPTAAELDAVIERLESIGNLCRQVLV